MKWQVIMFESASGVPVAIDTFSDETEATKFYFASLNDLSDSYRGCGYAVTLNPTEDGRLSVSDHGMAFPKTDGVSDLD